MTLLHDLFTRAARLAFDETGVTVTAPHSLENSIALSDIGHVELHSRRQLVIGHAKTGDATPPVTSLPIRTLHAEDYLDHLLQSLDAIGPPLYSKILAGNLEYSRPWHVDEVLPGETTRVTITRGPGEGELTVDTGERRFVCESRGRRSTAEVVLRPAEQEHPGAEIHVTADRVLLQNGFVLATFDRFAIPTPFEPYKPTGFLLRVPGGQELLYESASRRLFRDSRLVGSFTPTDDGVHVEFTDPTPIATVLMVIGIGRFLDRHPKARPIAQLAEPPIEETLTESVGRARIRLLLLVGPLVITIIGLLAAIATREPVIAWVALFYAIVIPFGIVKLGAWISGQRGRCNTTSRAIHLARQTFRICMGRFGHTSPRSYREIGHVEVRARGVRAWTASGIRRRPTFALGYRFDKQTVDGLFDVLRERAPDHVFAITERGTTRYSREWSFDEWTPGREDVSEVRFIARARRERARIELPESHASIRERGNTVVGLEDAFVESHLLGLRGRTVQLHNGMPLGHLRHCGRGRARLELSDETVFEISAAERVVRRDGEVFATMTAMQHGPVVRFESPTPQALAILILTIVHRCGARRRLATA